MPPKIALIAAALAVLTGCTTSAYHYADPNRHVVVLDQVPISVLETDPNTWEAWGGHQTRPDHQQFEWQIKAIEIVSGCEILNSQPDPADARRLTATVRCPAPKQTL